MNVLVLTSGGDAPGMNAVVHHITKYLSKRRHRVFASLYGFQGLLDNNVVLLTTSETNKHKNKAGSFIKSSRCLEFKREKGQKRAIETLEKRQIDLVIAIGGDGTFRGSKTLKDYGKDVIFIPGTIDKDLHYETYSVGFNTASHACQKYIESVRPTMEAFDRVCIYEVMGRDNPSLANDVALKVQADLLINIENKNSIDWESFQIKYEKNPVLTVVLQEKILPMHYVESLIEEKTNGGGVRSCVIGYVQRGTRPTKIEIKNARLFAKEISKMVKAKTFNRAVSLEDGKTKNIDLL